MVSFSFSKTKPKSTDAVLLPLFRDHTTPSMRAPFTGLSSPQKRAVRKVLQQNGLPRSGIIPVFSNDPAPVYLLLLSEREEFSRRKARETGEKIWHWSKDCSFSTLGICSGMLQKTEWEAFQEGVLLGSYEFREWKGKKSEKEAEAENKIENIIFYADKNTPRQKLLTALYESVKRTKDIINLPSQTATPEFLEKHATELAKLPKVSLTVLKEKELKKEGCGGIIGVGQGSLHESRLIILEYKGGGKEAPIALLGKGVTFDTGGLSIKPSRGMTTMKQDLGGAATVLGAFQLIVESGIAQNVLVVVPTVENAVSAAAYKPDDVLRMYNGVTVEVTNTDAEGRLILADALAYTEKNFKPRAMVDLATLTGACAYAVGDDFAALLGTDTHLVQRLLKAGKASDEALWELPLHTPYIKQMKSSVADVVNASMKLKPGTIEGGLFLSHFVTKKTPWCHIDIASVTFDDKKGLATGRNVRMLWNFVREFT